MHYEDLRNPDAKAIFIAEAGINHDGNIDIAKKMIEAAAKSGATYVKFQSFKADKLVTPTALTSSYIDAGSHKGESFRDLLHRLEVNEEGHHELKAHCNTHKIKFLSTAFDEASFDFLVELGIDVVKIASGDLTNTPLLRHTAAAKLPIFLSTGMSTLGEIEEAVTAIQKEGNNQIVLLHCISWYPASIATSQLRYMETLRSAFGFPVGYSDHTLGTTMTIAARALGAVVLEKHFTMDSTQFGPDHAASIEPEEMCKMVKAIREVEAGLGSSVRMFCEKELGQRKVHRRSIVIRTSVEKGEIFSDKNLAIKRPGTGIQPNHFEQIKGRHAARDLSPETILTWADISE